VLRLDRQSHRLVIRHVVALPEPVEELEAEIPAECLLDHRAIAAAGARRADLDPPQDFLVDRECGPNLCHDCIFAS